MLALSGCGSQVEDWVRAEARSPELATLPISLKNSGTTEFISGGLPYQTNNQQGYRTSGSIGGIYAGGVQSSSQGYKVYSSVQGGLISEDVAP